MNDQDELKATLVEIFREVRGRAARELQLVQEVTSRASEPLASSRGLQTPVTDPDRDSAAGKMTRTLEGVVASMDLYLRVLDGFSSAELRAFLLGLGVGWLPFPYWGRADLDERIGTVERLLPTLEQIEAAAGKDELREMMKATPLWPSLSALPPPFVPRAVPLRRIRTILRAMRAFL